MEQVVKKMPDAGTWIKDLAGPLMGIIAGWLLSSFSRVSKNDFEAFKRDRHTDLEKFRTDTLASLDHIQKDSRQSSIEVSAKLEALNVGLGQRVTRAELRESIDAMKLDWKEWINDLKLEIRALKRHD